jgi:septation ring formation regulator EzrA
MPEGENITVRTVVTKIENMAASIDSTLKPALNKLDMLDVSLKAVVTKIENMVTGIDNTLKSALDRLDALGASLNNLATRIETLQRGMTFEVHTAPGTVMEKRIVTSTVTKRNDVEITILQRSVEVKLA